MENMMYEYETERTYAIKLSAHEINTLLACLCRISGDDNGPRGTADNVGRLLCEALTSREVGAYDWFEGAQEYLAERGYAVTGSLHATGIAKRWIV